MARVLSNLLNCTVSGSQLLCQEFGQLFSQWQISVYTIPVFISSPGSFCLDAVFSGQHETNLLGERYGHWIKTFLTYLYV